MGFYQCAAAIPDVFDVTIPDGLDHLTTWLKILKWPADIGVDLIMPGSCFGSYRRQLWLGSCLPIIFLIGFASIFIARELIQNRRNLQQDAGLWAANALRVGLRESLPMILWVTFILVPSTSRRIFDTFLCSRFDYDDAAGDTRRYLLRDLSLFCDGSEYEATRRVAIALCLVWPIGVAAPRLEPRLR